MKPLQQTRLLLVAVLTATACALNPQPIPPDDDSRAGGDGEETPGAGGTSGMNGSSGSSPTEPGSFNDAGAEPADGGREPDAGETDAGEPDAGDLDAGSEDAAASDASTPDAE